MYKIKNKLLFRIFLIIVLLGLFTTITTFIFLSENKILLIIISLIIFLITYRRLKFGLLLIAFSIPLIPRLPQTFGTANFSIAELILLIVLLNWALSILIKKQFEFKKTKLDMWIIIFLILTIISFIITLTKTPFSLTYTTSANFFYPIKVLLNTIEVFLLYFLIINTVNKKLIKKLITTSLIALFIVSLISIFQYFNPEYNQFYPEKNHKIITIENQALKIKLKPIKILRWGDGISSREILINPNKEFYFEGYIKVRELSENASTNFIIVAYNDTSVIQRIWTKPIKNITKDWIKITKKFKLKNDSVKLRIRSRIGTKNNTIKATAYFDNITLKQNNKTIFSEQFKDIRKWHIMDMMNRTMGLFNHANFLGMYLIMLIPLLFLFVINCKRIYYTIPFIASLISLLFTFSRGAWMGLTFTFLIFIKKNKKNLILLFILITIGLAIIAIKPPLLEPFIDRTQDLTFDARLKIFNQSFNFIKRAPLLGIGLGTYRMYSEKYNEEQIHHAHNIYLQMLVERGIPALIAFLILLFVFYKQTLKTKTKDKYLKIVKYGLLMGITAILIHGFVDYIFYSQRIHVIFWMIVAIITCINEQGIKFQQHG